VFEKAFKRHDAVALAYCLMGNHYHVLLQTRAPNLSRTMRYVNGVFSQRSNRRHEHEGHVFQGRFHAVVVDRDAYLVAVCRYIEQNPVRAGLVATAGAWRWSSYRAHIGAAPAPAWLDIDALHAFLLGRAIRGDGDRRRARKRYAELVADATSASPWSVALRQQIFLGDDEFVAAAMSHVDAKRKVEREIPRGQRIPQVAAGGWSKRSWNRDTDLLRAYREGGQTMTAIARRFGLSVSRVSRLIAREEAKGKT